MGTCIQENAFSEGQSTECRMCGGKSMAVRMCISHQFISLLQARHFGLVGAVHSHRTCLPRSLGWSPSTLKQTQTILGLRSLHSENVVSQCTSSLLTCSGNRAAMNPWQIGCIANSVRPIMFILTCPIACIDQTLHAAAASHFESFVAKVASVASGFSDDPWLQVATLYHDFGIARIACGIGNNSLLSAFEFALQAHEDQQRRATLQQSCQVSKEANDVPRCLAGSLVLGLASRSSSTAGTSGRQSAFARRASNGIALRTRYDQCKKHCKCRIAQACAGALAFGAVAYRLHNCRDVAVCEFDFV